MTGKNNTYADFAQRQNTLRSLVERTADVFESLGQKSWSGSLKTLAEKVASDTFRVMILGNFKSGKSTFINALLGSDVLPAYAIPCTAVINEVKWGADRRAVLHFRDPLPRPLPDGLAAGAVVHLQATGNAKPAPMEIGVEQLEEYVVIADPSKPQDESVAKTPYERVELFWPLPLCENRVEIIDSPGLNEAGVREKVTADYLGKADAVIFVMTCLALASQREVDFVEDSIHPAGHDSIFFVCNRFDQIGSAREQDRVRDFALKKLRPLTDLGDRGVFFTSALSALDDRLAGGAGANSGVPAVEAALAQFLVTQRGKVKILQPARELKRACAEISNRLLPGERGLSKLGIGELEAKYKETAPKLESLRRRRDQILQQIEYHRGTLSRDVRWELASLLQRIINELPTMAKGVPTKTEVPLSPIGQKAKMEKLVEETSGALEATIKKEINDWKTSSLNPLLEKRLNALAAELTQNVDGFYAQVDDIKADFSAGTAAALSIGDATGVQRFFGALTGFLVGDLYSALHGARFGFDGLLPAVGTQIGLLLALTVVGITNPWIVVPALIGGGVFSALRNVVGLTEKVKEKVGVELAHVLADKREQFTEQVCEKVVAKITGISDAAQATLTREIEGIEEQVNAARNALEAGEAEVAKRQSKLDAMEREIGEVNTKLDELIFSVA